MKSRTSKSMIKRDNMEDLTERIYENKNHMNQLQVKLLEEKDRQCQLAS